jgi:hypothetical protein
VEVAVKHELLDELKSKAEIVFSKTEVKKMPRRERIERWATLLEHHQGRLLPFLRTEYLSYEARRALRADNSPLALAFSDPILRNDGLASDTLGDGIDYFGLSEQKAHRLLCDCHYSGTMTGKEVASRLRTAAQPGLGERLWAWATGRGDDS